LDTERLPTVVVGQAIGAYVLAACGEEIAWRGAKQFGRTNEKHNFFTHQQLLVPSLGRVLYGKFKHKIPQLGRFCLEAWNVSTFSGD
jgi:hypothetical protein